MPTPDRVPPVPTEHANPSTFPSCLLPDFGAGRLVVAAPVGEVVELVGPDRPVRLLRRDLGGEPLGIAYVIVWIGIGRGRHQPQIGAAQPQHVLFFLALRLGHDDDRAVAAGITDQRQADAGIAGGALDNDPAGPQQPALLGVLDDVKCGAVLDRAAGVQKLCLAEDRAPGLLRGPPQFDQRRVADRPDKAVANFHLPSSSWRGAILPVRLSGASCREQAGAIYASLCMA